ncbi:MAG: hypothetical protein IKQ41_09930 [Clostridia bacterium]|nr:hypothetical protein [Clostridia bacterium]
MKRRWTAFFLAVLIGVWVYLPVGSASSFSVMNLETDRTPAPEQPAQPQDPPAEDTAVKSYSAAGIILEGAALRSGIWYLQPSGAQQKLRFYWTGEEADNYLIAILDSEAQPVASQTLSSPEWRPAAGDWADGNVYTLVVYALKADGGEVYRLSLVFSISLPVPRPTSAPASSRDIIRISADVTATPTPNAGATATQTPGGAAATPTPTAKPGSTKKPSSHGGGSKPGGGKSKATATPKPTVQPVSAELENLPKDPMTALTLNGETLGIALDGGSGRFTAAVEGHVLLLAPVDETGEWTLTQQALAALAEAGITAVEVTLGERTYTLQPAKTDAKDKAKSSLLQDIVWIVNEQGVCWQYADQTVLWSLPEPSIDG